MMGYKEYKLLMYPKMLSMFLRDTFPLLFALLLFNPTVGAITIGVLLQAFNLTNYVVWKKTEGKTK